MHRFFSAHTVFSRGVGREALLGEPTARLLWMEAGSHPSVSSWDPLDDAEIGGGGVLMTGWLRVWARRPAAE